MGARDKEGHERPPLDLQALINPSSVAVIGATEDPRRHTGRCIANLDRTGYRGRIFPVNPNREMVAGHPAYPSVLDIDEDVEAAYILLSSARALEALEQCVAKGLRSAVICASGYAEEGEEGRVAQEALAEVVRGSALRLLGPNCIGVINPVDAFVGAPSFNITYEDTAGTIALVSQSGAMGTNLFSRCQTRGIGLRAMVSLGNEADLELGELVHAFIDDPSTSVIALYVEELRDASRFLSAARRAREAGKPIVVLKTGRSDAGRRMVFGHTGRMAGQSAIFSSVMRQVGVLEVDSFDELINAAHALSRFPAPAGRRLGLLSISGGESSHLADRASARGLELPMLHADTVASLKPLMPFGAPSNPMDATGQILRDHDYLAGVLEHFSQDPNFDLMLYTMPTLCEIDSRALLPSFIEIARDSDVPTVVARWQARGLTEFGDDLLRESDDVVSFVDADQALVALSHLVRYHEMEAAPAADAQPNGALAPIEVPRPATASLSEHAAKVVLSSAITVSQEVMVAGVHEVEAAAATLGGTVVVKALARGVVHKSDLGLVRLGLASPEAAAVAAAELAEVAAQSGHELEGYLVAEQVDGLEVILGGVRDPVFGPVVMIGAGGILAELIDDTVFCPCPVAPDVAHRALSGLRIGQVLDGVRGRTYDTDALVRLVSDFSRVFAGSPWMDEVDINPVIVRPRAIGGAVAVDAAIRILEPEAPPA